MTWAGLPWGYIYGVATVLVVAATWATRAQPLALTMAVAYLLSNVIAYGAPFEARPILFPIIDVFVVGIVVLLFLHGEMPRWAAVPMVGLSVLACAAAVAFWLTAGEKAERDLYGIVVNTIFALQLFVTLVWGVADVVGQSRHGDQYSIGRAIGYRLGLERGHDLAPEAPEPAPKNEG